MIRAMVDSVTKVIDDTRAAVSPSYAENRSRLRSEVEADDRRRRLLAQRAERRRTDLRNLMDTDWGRRIAWDLLCRCQYQGPTWHENPRISDRQEGKREIAISIAGELVSVSVELYQKMEAEAYLDAQRE